MEINAGDNREVAQGMERTEHLKDTLNGRINTVNDLFHIEEEKH
jgi:hypothetical protein